MRIAAFVVVTLFAAPTLAGGDAHDYSEGGSHKDAEMGVAIRSIQRRWNLAGGGLANGYGIGVTQHTHFGKKFGADVGASFSTGTDARGYVRSDFEFLMPGFAFRVPVEGDVQPYLTTGFVMTGSWFNAPGTPGFMYAGNVSGIGLEWRASKSLAWTLELDATIRGRFAVDKRDRPTLDNDPALNRHTRVVHELSLVMGAVLF